MPENNAESLTPEVLGEEVGDDERPAAGYPPEEPLGVEDDSIVRGGVIARDDVESREDRLQPEAAEGGDRAVQQRTDIGLTDTDRASDGRDDEERMLADEVDAESSPEGDAMHVESAPDDA
ncbi:hypothetical protein [Ilumatobacter sp.]|uniref:hypothetical protein n=1 Tax=Ilumatobacter sp. TaxID=1967498 RepID=UPI003B517BC9